MSSATKLLLSSLLYINKLTYSLHLKYMDKLYDSNKDYKLQAQRKTLFANKLLRSGRMRSIVNCLNQSEELPGPDE